MKTNNIYIIIVFLTFIMTNLLLVSPCIIMGNINIEVTPNTKVEIGDVVILNYTLWIEENDSYFIADSQNGTVWVHNPEENEPPLELYETYPDIHVPPNIGFMEGILGMNLQDQPSKSFDVKFSSGKAFNNKSDSLYGKDLFYDVDLQKILYDASPSSPSIFDNPFILTLTILIILLILAYPSVRTYQFLNTRVVSRLKTRCHLCGKLAEIRCGNEGCNTPYCKKCFISNNGCEICRSNKMMPLKKPD